MRGTVKLITVLVIGFLLINCEKDENCAFQLYPHISTLPLKELQLTSATFEAEITYEGDYEISAYGFVWGLYTNPEVGDNYSANVTLDGDVDDNFFSAKIQADFYEGQPYHVRAFLISGDKVFYGSDEEFITLTSD